MNDQPTRVALVSGGAKGIGAAIAARLSRDGWRVVVADRAPGGAAPFGGRYVECDVANEEGVSAVLRSVDAAEQRLDALICNAGFMIRKPIADMSLAEWSSVLATNLTSTFLLVRAAERLLRAAKGVIVTIASSRARMSERDTEPYSASKGGLVALTHALAISLGPDVRAACISPGWIQTEGPEPSAEEHAFHPAGRVGRA
jgi:NAD(P)-dependent dehydrogenase (short-subunit alcohol dehydrogenase family)